MITRVLPCSVLRVIAAWVFIFGIIGIVETFAVGEGSYHIQLIWGTDGERPKDKPLKDVDAKLLEKLRAVFKWKNYYEVSQKNLAVPKQGAQKLKLSEKCEIEIQDLGSSRIEIRLFGEGKLVVQKKQAVVPDEPIVLGGGDKDQNAWFVVLMPK